MEKLWESLKQHPWLVALGVLILAVTLWLIFRGGGTSGISDYQAAAQAAAAEYASQTQAATALQAAQLQAQATEAGQTAQTNDITAQYAGESDLAQIAATAGVASQQIAANAQVSTADIAGTTATAVTSLTTQNATKSQFIQSMFDFLNNPNPGPAGAENVKPWLLVMENDLFGNANADLSNTYVGPNGQTTHDPNMAKYLGWIGGAQIGQSTSYDQSTEGVAQATYAEAGLGYNPTQKEIASLNPKNTLPNNNNPFGGNFNFQGVSGIPSDFTFPHM